MSASNPFGGSFDGRAALRAALEVRSSFMTLRQVKRYVR